MRAEWCKYIVYDNTGDFFEPEFFVTLKQAKEFAIERVEEMVENFGNVDQFEVIIAEIKPQARFKLDATSLEEVDVEDE